VQSGAWIAGNDFKLLLDSKAKPIKVTEEVSINGYDTMLLHPKKHAHI
jgi:hypothetical protein